MRVLQIIQKLPLYFKILVIGILVLNLSAIYSFQERAEVQKGIIPIIKLTDQAEKLLTFENGELNTEKKVFTDKTYSVGVLMKPKTENYLFYQKDKLEINITGKNTVIPYDKENKQDMSIQTINIFNDFLLGTFFVSIIQHFLMLSLLLVALIVAALVLTKFSLKTKRAINALFLGILPATSLSVFSSLKVNVNWQMIIFAVILGIIYSLALRKDLDARLTSYYLGEGVL